MEQDDNKSNKTAKERKLEYFGNIMRNCCNKILKLVQDKVKIEGDKTIDLENIIQIIQSDRKQCQMMKGDIPYSYRDPYFFLIHILLDNLSNSTSKLTCDGQKICETC